MPAKHLTIETTSFGRIVLAAAAVAAAGCTSPLTTVALREFLRESTMTLAFDAEAEESAKPDEDDQAAASATELDTEPGSGDEADDDAVEELSIEKRIERSLERLTRTGGLDSVARDVLVDTLDKAATEDWPDIIDSFAASLETSPPRSTSNEPTASSVGETSSQQATKPVGGLTIPVAATLPVAEQPAVAEAEPSVVAEVHEEPVAAETQDDLEEPKPTESPQEIVAMLKERLAEARRNAPLTVRRTCFASKVRGWGNLDAFDEPRFVPGQDVLVYVELDNLDGIESPRGFSTRVEASLRLLDAAGGVVEQWSFPLVEDRSDSPRTDYFVRYLVRIPSHASAGPHRLEAAITDAVSSKTVTTELTLAVAKDAAASIR